MTKPRTLFKEAYNNCLRLLEADDSLPSEPELAARLGISRTTVRSILTGLSEAGIIVWNKRDKQLLRRPVAKDFYPEDETSSLSSIIERSFMQRILAGGARAGDQISELELARQIGVGTSALREFLIRFSRFGLIEKRRNSQWVLKGFTLDFALELADVREMFELRSARAFAELPPGHPAWTQLAEMEAEHHQLAAQIDARYADFSALDERFHRMVLEASRNRFIIDFYDVIAMVFHYHYQWNKASEKERNKVALGEHLDYIRALKAGDVAAVDAACRKHLASARATLLMSVPESEAAGELPTPNAERQLSALSP
ncbi:GntR family transcriptional regulator [Radicibacter daui]|uniref:GntR family transcriptional regulator n=1 Tax=Radicibacter daui TaxID=3064829 RepID=UPI004046C6B7